MLADQVSGGNTYVTEILCQMSYGKYQGGGTIYYTPRMITQNGVTSVPSCTEPDTGTNPLTNNKFTQTQIDAINAAISSDSDGGSGIDLSGPESAVTVIVITTLRTSVFTRHRWS